MDESIGSGTLRKVNECYGGQEWCCRGVPLFDEYWRGGELALLTGPAGAGKSVFAVQIADALARGREMDGFMMPYWRQKVLYVDLMFSDQQFAARYSYFSEKKRIPKHYEFAEKFYRGRPNVPEELVEWLETAVRENAFDVVIIDDLSAVKRTHDGIRETLQLMRRLKRICSETGAAILVIAECEKPRPGRMVSEHDMGRSRVLCSVADSVIALGPVGCGHQRLFQLRSRHAKIFWNERNAPAGFVERLESGLLGFHFDERFDPHINDATLTLIKRIHTLRVKGKTFKAIADELGISKTRAFKLNKEWVPAMGGFEEAESADCGVQSAEPPTADCEVQTAEPPTADCGVQTEEFAFSNAINITPAGSGPVEVDALNPIPHSAVRTPQLKHGPERVSIYDLEHRIDRGGESIFVESVEEHSHKPKVWYKRDRRGNTFKLVRNGLGNTAVNLGRSEYL